MNKVKINIVSECCQSVEVLIENSNSCLGMDRIKNQLPHGLKLAIVGGGESTIKLIEELKSFDGDIWAVNNTCSWLLSHGIKSVFATVDPGDVSGFKTDGIEDALIATCCHPELKNKFKNVRLFDMIETHENGIVGGTSTASRLPSVALKLGYLDVSFFGCDGSFDIGNTHVDRNELREKDIVVVKAGDKEYITLLAFISQCESIAQLINLCPSVFKNKSGGLLQAFVDHPDSWEIVAVSAHVKRGIEEINGKLGLFEEKYHVNAAS